MNDVQVPEPEQVAVTPARSRPADPLRRWTLVILVLCVVLFGWTLIADRLRPGCSIKEAASVLAISVNNTKVLQHRALRMAARLAEELNQ